MSSIQFMQNFPSVDAQQPVSVASVAVLARGEHVGDEQLRLA
jgi:hypothetical protein